jgi:hypothetical protein
MAFSYVLDFERSIVHRQESLTIINNFLITFCQDNRLTASRLLPAGQDDSISDAGSGSIDTRGSDQTPVHQLLTIFEHCGFFDHIQEIFNVKSFVVPYRCALSSLFLNIAIVAPNYLLKKINNAGGWKLILDQLTGVDDMGMDSLECDVNCPLPYLNFSIRQFRIIYDDLGFEIKSNLLQTVRFLEYYDTEQITRNYLLNGTNYTDCLMAQIGQHISPGYYQDREKDLRIIGISCTLLGDVLRDYSQLYLSSLTKLFQKNNAVSNVIHACLELISSKEREFFVAGCLFLAKLTSLNYGRVADLGLDGFFNGEVGKVLGPLIVARLIEILGQEYGSADSIAMEAVRICLQCLFGSCAWAKYVAVGVNLPSKFMTRINSARYLTAGRSDVVERDMFVVICLLRHLMAGSVELKVCSMGFIGS